MRTAGLDVHVGVLASEAERLSAPYLKLLAQGRPWVIAKWAMTLDGHTATRAGASRWISNEASRAIVHELRGRVDAILVGRGTAMADDPLLTARPAGARVATRIVLDTQATLSLDSQLVRTAADAPVLLAATMSAPAVNVDRLRDAGCEVFLCLGATPRIAHGHLAYRIGTQTNDEYPDRRRSHIAGLALRRRRRGRGTRLPRTEDFGGANAPPAVGGIGVQDPPTAWSLDAPAIKVLAGDIYIHGHVRNRHT